MKIPLFGATLVLLTPTILFAEKVENEPYGDDYPYQLYVIASKLNVREGPGNRFEVLCTVSKGELVDVWEYRGDWMNIDGNICSGWAHGDFLHESERVVTEEELQQLKSMMTKNGAENKERGLEYLGSKVIKFFNSGYGILTIFSFPAVLFLLLDRLLRR